MYISPATAGPSSSINVLGSKVIHFHISAPFSSNHGNPQGLLGLQKNAFNQEV
jgi:hypothetical protein